MKQIFIVLAMLLFARAASASTPTYGGGRVIANPHVVLVDWNSQMHADVLAAAKGEYNALSRNQSVVNFLQEFNTPTQTFGAWRAFDDYYPITPFNRNTHLYDVGSGTDIYSELIAQITLRQLPAPDSNTLYVVHLPIGYTVTTIQGDSCASWCGIHWNGPNQTVPYVIVPDFTQSACATTCGDHTISPISNMQSTISHEVMETVTDPYSDAWNRPEIGDGCSEPLYPGHSHSLLQNPLGPPVVSQKMWSDLHGFCSPIEPATICCSPLLGATASCVAVGAGEACGLNGNNLDGEIPIVLGSLFSLSAYEFSCTTYPGGIDAPGSGDCATFSGYYSPASLGAHVCFDTTNRPRIPIERCVNHVCTQLHSYMDIHNRMCADGIANVIGQ